MKCAASLKVSPPSFINIVALIPTCTTKNEMRNRPVRPTTNFLPMDEHYQWTGMVLHHSLPQSWQKNPFWAKCHLEK